MGLRVYGLEGLRQFRGFCLGFRVWSLSEPGFGIERCEETRCIGIDWGN